MKNNHKNRILTEKERKTEDKEWEGRTRQEQTNTKKPERYLVCRLDVGNMERNKLIKVKEPA